MWWCLTMKIILKKNGWKIIFYQHCWYYISEITVQLGDQQSISKVIHLLFNNDFFDLITFKKINLYQYQIYIIKIIPNINKKNCIKSLIGTLSWVETINRNIKNFLGLLILMRQIKKLEWKIISHLILCLKHPCFQKLYRMRFK